MAKAYRRPVQEADVKRFLALFGQQFALNHSLAKSLVSTYTAVLTSPGWLYIQESPGKLDDYALATRLALFLWNSPPDEELRSLAAAGRSPQSRRSEGPDRPAAQRREVPPLHRRLYRLLARSPQDRRHLSLHHAVQRLRTGRPAQARRRGRDAALRPGDCSTKNLPARTVVDSDFTFLNERLAQHYGIARRHRSRDAQGGAPEGLRARRTHDAGQRPEGHRQRHHHLAVIRGVWIMERISATKRPRRRGARYRADIAAR